MKNKNNLSDIFLYPTAITVGFFIRVMPLAVSLWFARRLGSFVYIFYRKRRGIGYANIKAAFCKTMTPAEIKKTTRMVFQHFAQTLFEIFKFPLIDKDYVDRHVKSEGLNYIADAIAKGRGAIILTAHFGNWELSGLAGAIRGYPQDVLARQQKHPRLNSLLNSYRQRYGRRVIEKGMATRDIITSLKNNKLIAILSDQDGGPSGCLVNFFGRLASTPKGAMVFALKFDSPVLPNFCVRDKGQFYRMVVEPAMELKNTGNLEMDTQQNLQRFTDILQSYIARYPGQWLWLHKRWKTTPSRRILILTDGKAGHLNQAMALAKQIRKVVFENAEKDERVQALKKSIGVDELIYQEKTEEVKYKSKMHKAILAVCSLFASSGCQGCMKCVKFCLSPDSYKNIISNYADIIISCGSSAAPVNRFLCKENRARGISIMKPGMLPESMFNLCIIPRHDKPRPANNILITEGALNLTEAKTGGDSIGLLIGGDNKNFILSEQDVEKILDAVVNISTKFGKPVLATTSRRTSAGLEKLVQEKLGAFKNCNMLVIANENNPAGTVNKILDLSSIVIVSGESISMVSEAAASGKRILVFQPEIKKQNSKHMKFLKNLEDNNFIILCRPQDVENAFYDKRPLRRLDDNKSVFEAVKKIV